MPKILDRPYSRYTLDALALLGNLIRERRVTRRMKTEELAVRAGISRDLLRKIERGDPSCTIGAMFEVAAIVGVPLFDDSASTLALRVAHSAEKKALLPKAVRSTKVIIDDDF